MSFGASEGARNPYLRADSLDDLLSWHDVEFVRCAYVTILGRQPDPEGETYYTRRIQLGYSKLTILSQLRNSEEAKSHDPGIAGFDRALRRHRLSRLPFIGPLFRNSVDDGRDGPVERQLRAIGNVLNAIRSGSEAEQDRNSVRAAKLEKKLDLIQHRLAELSASQGISARRINQAEGPCEETWTDALRQVLS